MGTIWGVPDRGQTPGGEFRDLLRGNGKLRWNEDIMEG